jgi:hypothetical protein
MGSFADTAGDRTCSNGVSADQAGGPVLFSGADRDNYASGAIEISFYLGPGTQMQQHDRQSTEFLLAIVDRSRHGKKKDFGQISYCVLKKGSTGRSQLYSYITQP